MSSEQTSGALSGAASGASTGAVFGPWGAAIGAVVGGVAGYFSAKKKPTYKPIDINQLMSDARTQYADNWKRSVAMEQGVNPTLSGVANQTSAGFKARNSFLDDLLGGNGDLLNESSARTLQQLRLGGKLDPETQNAVMRGALSKGGDAGITGSGANRGLSARDLGLTSLSLQQSRLDRATQMGSLLQQLGLSKFNAGEAAANTDTQSAYAVSSIYSHLPTSGLDPMEIAGLKVKENSNINDFGALGTKMDNQANADSMQALLGLGTTAGKYFGKGGGSTGVAGGGA